MRTGDRFRNWLWSRSRVAVYPFGSRLEPLVVAPTVMSPVSGGSRLAEGFGEAGLSQPSAHPTTIGTTYWRSVLRARMTRAPHGGTACARGISRTCGALALH